MVQYKCLAKVGFYSNANGGISGYASAATLKEHFLLDTRALLKQMNRFWPNPAG